jgi:hypothetical protein
MKSANNSHSRSPAQWLRAGTQEIPPLAFAIPEDEFVRILHGFRTPDEQRLRKIVESQLLARYGVIVTRLESKRDGVAPVIEYLEQQRESLVTHIEESAAQIIPDGEPIAKLPHGLKCAHLIGLVLIAFLLAIFDWITAAGFAARAETHDLALALFFTALVPLAPLAVELYLRRINRLGWSAGRLFELCLEVSLIAIFLWSFVAVYAAPDESLNNIANMLGSPGSFHGVDKRLLLFTQLVAGIVIGIAFVSEVPTLLIYSRRDVVNPNWLVADAERSKLDNRLAHARQQLADPVGNLREWQHSIEAQVASGLAYIELRTRKIEASRIYQTHLAQSLTELDAELTIWSSPRVSNKTRR